MATFHPFPRLPFELRAMVWALAAEPRTVQIDVDYAERINPQVGQSDVMGIYCSSTPVPAVLHTCQESRKQSPYEKLFYSEETEPCYVWVNFDLDMFDIGTGHVNILFRNRSRVRRLKFEFDHTQYDCWVSEDFEAWQFENLVEFHVVVGDLRECATFWDVDFLPSKQGKFVFIDRRTGMTMNSCDLYDMVWRLLIMTWLCLGNDDETDGEGLSPGPI
ncbi:hypothetical protein MHUMG1_08278 [Metarhizium humberi]|uniref:2EXR domain-containing protein n=1 Tax=Metarhizium humberi TaxID=2596975 RepID=A0A9P8M4I4_9HYPO|nr:hypothetical protein MHUMG1_08278 [Metarhizium humberi]